MSHDSDLDQDTDGPFCDLMSGVGCLERLDEDATVAEQRGGRRRNLSIPVWIRIITGADLGPAQARQLTDISPNGLGFLSKVPIETGRYLVVELCINNVTWNGAMLVTHCTELAGGYKIGLVVEDSAAPSAPTKEGRRPHTTNNLAKLQEEIPKAMRAYRQARLSWGLLGTPLRNNVARVIANLPPVNDGYKGKCQRRHRRRKLKGDVHLVVPTYYGGKWLRAQVMDISEGGAGLCLPLTLATDHIERELAGEFKICAHMAVIVGIGSEPNTVWLPAEITHCSKPKGAAMRIGVQFNTPDAQKAFGA
jgi:hypothetical protein